MTFTTFIIKFVAVVACALFGAGFSADMAKAYKHDNFSEFGLSFTLAVGFITALIKVIWM